MADNDGGIDASFDAFEVAFPAPVEEEFSAAYGDVHWHEIKRALAKPYVGGSNGWRRTRMAGD